MSSESESLATAEQAREQWKSPSFLKELFLGSLRLDLIEPFPEHAIGEGQFFDFYNKMMDLLDKTDSAKIDATGEYPPELIDGLRKIGAFGMKIPIKYGGLGLSQSEYDQVMQLLGSRDGSITALMSAHQSIGAPQPLKLFGTEEQKRKYLPPLAAGAISAFALTEPNVGSDPARMETTVTRLENGDFRLNGKKLWCTNGTLAEYIVVMARHDDTKKLSAFIVETQWLGIKIEHRCRFMGLKALANAVISFNDVRIPAENVIGKEGEGLKIALVTLNTGRLSIPAAAVGAAKKCLKICRDWATKRVQWGHPIGKHEAIAHKLSDMASTVFAMEAVSELGSRLASRPGYDIRLEAAAAKEFNTWYGWKIVDETMQIRGGRGYENESSLAARGEEPIPVERMMRDLRINLIFEGSSEIMHLFMAREAVDRHLQVAGDMLDPTKGIWDKLKTMVKCGLFYGQWFPKRLFSFNWFKFRRFGALAGHMRFIDSSCKKLARNTFYAMLLYRAKMQQKQAFLFRLVDIGLDLYAMSAAILKAQGEEASIELAYAFCDQARRRIEQKFRDLWDNEDDAKYALGKSLLGPSYGWIDPPM